MTEERFAAYLAMLREEHRYKASREGHILTVDDFEAMAKELEADVLWKKELWQELGL